jgi:hypothetical protein
VLNPAMSETKVSRRGHGEDAIYFTAAKNRYVGSVSLGYGPDGKRIRCEVFGKTKQEVRARLKGTAPGAERGRQVIAHLFSAGGGGGLAARGAGRSTSSPSWLVVMSAPCARLGASGTTV